MHNPTTVIVGVGLIGGSLARALRIRNLATEIIGIESNAASARWALDHGLVDRIEAHIPDNADLIALCTPSDQIAQWVIDLAEHPAMVIDVASVKAPIVQVLDEHQQRFPRFVPCHPISGSEKSGPEAATEDLFTAATVVVTPGAETDTLVKNQVIEFWEALGASVLEMTAQAHDEALALTSHLPHLLAFAYMQQVEADHLPLTGGGFRDFTRIAEANPELWWRIFALNKAPLLAALSGFGEQIDALAQAIEQDDRASGLAIIAEAAGRRETYAKHD